MAVQAEEAVFPHDLAGVAELLHRDVIEVVGAIYGGARVGLGQHERMALPGLRPYLLRQRREGVRPWLVIAQDAEACSWNCTQGRTVRPVNQVVFTAAQEGEVTIGQPAKPFLRLRAFSRRKQR